jgi:hypothetical protein
MLTEHFHKVAGTAPKPGDTRQPNFQLMVRAQFKSQVPIRVDQVTAQILGN